MEDNKLYMLEDDQLVEVSGGVINNSTVTYGREVSDPWHLDPWNRGNHEFNYGNTPQETQSVK